MTIADVTDTKEYLFSEITMDLTWDIHPGAVMNRFFELLQEEKRLYGMYCPECKRVYLPPRPVCGNCWRELTDWVPLKNKGTIVAKTACYYTLLDNSTGIRKPTPFVLALIQLHGADTTFNHFIETDDPSEVEIGKEVEIVFRDKMEGNMEDIRFFRLING